MLTNNNEDVFSASESADMVKELNALKERTAQMPLYFKTEIIISYLKNHSIKNDWIEANPSLAKLMTSNTCVTNHIESLFIFCRNKQPYLRDYEAYIKSFLLTGTGS